MEEKALTKAAAVPWSKPAEPVAAGINVAENPPVETKLPGAGYKYIYGPVASRRLGRSLGLDLVPFKTCPYDCTYCQLGRTTRKTLDRKEYVPIDEVFRELTLKLATSVQIDYISLAGQGEPTLNLCIGELIEKIKKHTSIPVAVLTNGSLLWIPEIREALLAADLVIPSLDAGDEAVFRKINRPHREISFAQMVQGLIDFSAVFPREVWLEVFLQKGLNDSEAEVSEIAKLAKIIAPARVQLNTVTRLPAEADAEAVSPGELDKLKQLFFGKVENISDVDNLPFSEDNREITEAEILASLQRRPSTVRNLASGLGLHQTAAGKILHRLMEAGKIESMRLGDEILFKLMEKH